MQLASPAQTTPDTWLSRPQAVAVLGLSAASFDRLVAAGRVVARRVEGCHPRYSLQSVQALRLDGQPLDQVPRDGH